MAGSGTAHLRADEEPLLSVEHLVQEFRSARGARVHAVSDVSFDLLDGETLGLVGESGCGKSTTGRALMQLHPVTSGTVTFAGDDLGSLSKSALREIRPQLQMVFQDPISSLNPRLKVRDIIAEPLNIWGIGTQQERTEKVREVLETVGLDPETSMDRRPHELSGGQCQRISIARALVLEPKVIVCDEPVSALDVSVQAQILNLLEDMKDRYGLTLIFISHDLAVVKNISDRIAVMYLGKLCEIAGPQQLFGTPAHPYTAALLAAIPRADPEALSGISPGISGELPSPTDPPSGCRFRTRCPYASQVCADEEPTMTKVAPGHYVACHHRIEPT
jgi:peptide/nickel transport system ATP-binding protein